MRSAVVALLALLATAASVVAADETARQILDRRRELDQTTRRWTDRYQEMSLTISDGASDRQRTLESYERRYPAGESKSLVIFTGPADVRGTGLLAVSHTGRPADQWLYVPATQRTRQITAQSRDQSFAGTDLTYSDLDLLSSMLDWTEADATSSLLRHETIDGVDCHVIALEPKRADVGYGRIVVWLGRDDLVPRQVEFYRKAEGGGWLGLGSAGASANDVPARRIRQSDVREVGRVPVAHRLIVESPEKKTNTDIRLSGIRIDAGIDDDVFTRRRLERGAD